MLDHLLFVQSKQSFIQGRMLQEPRDRVPMQLVERVQGGTFWKNGTTWRSEGGQVIARLRRD